MPISAKNPEMEIGVDGQRQAFPKFIFYGISILNAEKEIGCKAIDQIKNVSRLLILDLISIQASSKGLEIPFLMFNFNFLDGDFC